MTPRQFDTSLEFETTSLPESWSGEAINLLEYLNRKSKNDQFKKQFSKDELIDLLNNHSSLGWSRAFELFQQGLKLENDQICWETLLREENLIRLQFPNIVHWPFFRVCFLPSEKQAGFLFEYFTGLIIQEVKEIDDPELKAWIHRWESRDQDIKPLELAQLEIFFHKDLEELSQLITMAESFETSKYHFKKAYVFSSSCFVSMPIFRKLISWIPRANLHFDMLMELSKDQMANILLEKIQTLEWVNQEILNSNEALNEAYSDLDKAYKKTEQTLEQLNLILNTVEEGIIVSNKSGKIVMANTKCRKIWGYESGEITDIQFGNLIPNLGLSNEMNFLTQAQSLIGKTQRLKAKHKSEKTFSVEISFNEAIYEGSVFIIAAARDISEQEKLEKALAASKDNLEKQVENRTSDLNTAQKQLKQMIAELERSNDELKHFAYVASHDLQEPIRMIASYLQLIQRRYIESLDKEAQTYIDFAIDGARRMSDLIKDLLEYSRVGRKHSGVKSVNLNTILEVVQYNLAKHIDQTGAEITIIGKLPKLEANKTLMIRLFQNLIHNAIKFRSAEQPKIEIQTHELAEAYEFSIKDNGIGIEASSQERIFEIFQRLHRREEFPGTGIGLAICKKIAHYHGGDIRVESELGSGSNFIFTVSKSLAQDLEARTQPGESASNS